MPRIPEEILHHIDRVIRYTCPQQNTFRSQGDNIPEQMKEFKRRCHKNVQCDTACDIGKRLKAIPPSRWEK